MKRVIIAIVTVLVIGVIGFLILNLIGPKPQAASELEVKYLSQDDDFITVDGAQIRVRREGVQTAPKLILLHGFTSSLETWDSWAAELSDSYYVIRYDMLGHGLTGPDPQKRYSPDERAATLISVMNELEIDRATLAGNSLGGLVAWKSAIIAPERFDSLVLINAATFDFSGVEDGPAKPPAIVEYALRNPSLAGTKQMANFSYFNVDKITEERFITITDLMQREGNGDAFMDHLAEFSMPDPTEDLKQLETRTLLLVGAEDKLIPPALSEKASMILPNAELSIVPEAGHILHEDAPSQSLEIVNAFLAGNE